MGAPDSLPLFRLDPGADDDMTWQELALCRQVDPAPFFPKMGGSARAAKRICAMCDVRPECLSYALHTSPPPMGVWGGTTEDERLDIRRGRADVAA